MRNETEQKYCRAPMATMINKMEGWRWIPNINMRFPVANGKADNKPEADGLYEGGRPDAFVQASLNPSYPPFFMSVECKASDDGTVKTDCVQENQLEWNKWNPKALFYIGLAVYPERNHVGNFDLDQWQLYLIPLRAWVDLKNMAENMGTKTVPATAELGHGSRIDWNVLNICSILGVYRLSSYREKITFTKNGKQYYRTVQTYYIPVDHPIWNEITTKDVVLNLETVLE